MNNSADFVNDVSTHFAFGENWKNYAETIDERRIKAAVRELSRLLQRDSLSGMSFVDVGCGSGIHSLAAARLGAERVLAIDFDPTSVETCRNVLSRWAGDAKWECETCSVFELNTSWRRGFDIVYSWGVLHHTGDMWRAVRDAARLAKRDSGIFAVALYRKTPMCGFWKLEKRAYRKMPRPLQLLVVGVYSVADLARVLVRGQNPIRWVKDYQKKRGMNFWHDAHDWLGGYPYESASKEEIETFMKDLGFSMEAASGTEWSLGLTGSGCAEYLFVRSRVK